MQLYRKMAGFRLLSCSLLFDDGAHTKGQGKSISSARRGLVFPIFVLLEKMGVMVVEGC